MDIRKLQIFVRVAELGSFSQAAVSLHMAQPAVSIAIRKLEQSLGVALMDRASRRVLLTAEGRELLDRARRILADVEELKHAVAARDQLLEGELSIACPSMLATYFLPDLLTGFLSEHVGLRASVIQAGTARVEQMLLQDEVEIGVTTADAGEHRETLERIPLLRQSMLLCVTPDHPWSGRKRIRIEELDGAAMVLYESGYFIRSQLDDQCRKAAVTPDIRLQSNFLPLLLHMVRCGMGSTVGLDILAQREPDIIGIPLSPAMHIEVALAKRRGRTISRANQAFLDWAAFRL